MDLVIILLVAQGALGAFDVFYNHEWKARLPSQETAILELRIHAIRAVLYALLFAGIAWFKWNGATSWILLLLIVVEIGLTLWDFVIEDKTRNLSPTERVTHTILAMNGGAYVGFLCFEVFTTWMPERTQMEPVSYGVYSLILTAYAIGVFASGVRDGFASMALHRRKFLMHRDRYTP